MHFSPSNGRRPASQNQTFMYNGTNRISKARSSRCCFMSEGKQPVAIAPSSSPSSTHPRATPCLEGRKKTHLRFTPHPNAARQSPQLTHPCRPTQNACIPKKTELTAVPFSFKSTKSANKPPHAARPPKSKTPNHIIPHHTPNAGICIEADTYVHVCTSTHQISKQQNKIETKNVHVRWRSEAGNIACCPSYKK